MDVRKWLEDMGLGEHAPVFEEQAIEVEEDLVDLTVEDLKDLHVTKLGHRKKILAAIKRLSEGGSPGTDSAGPPVAEPDDALSNLVEALPHTVAMPLREYAQENHPGMKLWAACDVVELLLRFLVTVGVADRRRHGELDDKILKQLWGKIEMPTLGAWLAIAVSLAETKSKGAVLVPEIDAYVSGTLTSLLYGPEKPGTPDTSFLALRNRLAHGGGMTRNEAERLLGLWQAPFEAALEAATWLADLRVVGLDEEGTPIGLKGTSDSLGPAAGVAPERFEGNRDGVWLVRGEETLQLWPMALFGYPTRSTPTGTSQAHDENAVQVYVRKDVVSLQFTPLGAEGFSQSEAGATALEGFQHLFSLDRLQAQRTESAFEIRDFIQEIQRDANQMVGRVEEQEHIEGSFADIAQGVVWLTGPPGIGKSFLVARMAVALMEQHEDSDTLVLPYRFSSGDDMRCSRDAFAQFVIERLVAAGALIEGANSEKKDKAEEKLKAHLDLLSQGRKLILILDGLDELLSRDVDFAEDIPLALQYPGVVWVCAGRPEEALEKAFESHQAIRPYPEGLPPMRTRDIRGMLLEKIGPLRKKLLANDKEKKGGIVNPFIELVAKRADGLPLYVKYVIGDVLSNRYRVLDGQEDLPESLHAYHEKLIDGLGIGDLKAILTPLAATLAVAHEPLSEEEIIVFLVLRNVIPQGEIGKDLVGQGLAAIAPMLRRAPDPEGEEGLTLFHASLREHMLETPAMTASIATARRAFADAALTPDEQPAITNYLCRAGVDHLLDDGRDADARAKVLDLRLLDRMWRLGKEALDILRYWIRLGDENPGEQYLAAVEGFAARDLAEEDLEILRDVCTLQMQAGWYKAGVPIARLSYNAHEKLLDPDHEDTLASVINLGWLLSEMGDNEGAEALQRRALEASERTLGPDHSNTLNALGSLGLLLSKMGNYKGAEPLLRRDLEAQERTLGPDHKDTLISMNNLGLLLSEMGDNEGAERLYRRVLEASERTLGPDHPDTFASVNNFGLLLSKMGDNEGAEPLLRRALEASERTKGPDHPHTLTAVGNLGSLLSKMGDNEGAEPLLRRALEARERTLGPDHEDTVASLWSLATLLRDKGDHEGAEPLFRRELEACERTKGPDHEDTLRSVINLGGLLQDMGDLEGAEPVYRRALEARERTLGPDHEDTVASLWSLATLLRDKGDNVGAEPLYRRALEARERTLGPDHEDTVVSLWGLATLLRDKGDHEGAEPLFRRELEACERTKGPDHEDTLISVNNLGGLLQEIDDNVGAESLFRRELEACERTKGPDHEDTVASLWSLATLLRDKGDNVGAESLFRRELEACERTKGPDDEDTLTSKQRFGVFLRERGRPEEAIPLLEEILATRRQRTKGEPTEALSSALTALGTTLGARGRHNEAIGHLAESAEMRRRLFDEGDKNLETPLASTLKRLADVYEQVGKKKQAAQVRAEARVLEGEEDA